MTFQNSSRIWRTAPAGGFEWTLEMRHGLMHRARQLQINVTRETEIPTLHLPRRVLREVAFERLRADAHFRRKPWLPDMEHLADQATRATDAMLHELAVITMRGIVDATNHLVEDVSRWFLLNWDRHASLGRSPDQAWDLEPPKDVDFRGFAHESELRRTDVAMVSPRDAERLRLAQMLREGRS